MATARLPQKRILGESTNTRHNIPSSPASAKKRKLEPTSSPAARFKSSQNGPKGKLGSSQPSHFESEVLEKMTQDLEGLKKNNSEKDQEWARPGLGSFNPQTDSLCFQQIEAEEGTLHGGKTAVKLFGITEASRSLPSKGSPQADLPLYRSATPLCFTSPTSCTISMLLLLSLLAPMTVKATNSTSNLSSPNISPLYIWCRWSCERTCMGFKETSRIRT